MLSIFLIFILAASYCWEEKVYDSKLTERESDWNFIYNFLTSSKLNEEHEDVVIEEIVNESVAAEDRQAISLSELSVNTIEEIFEGSILKLPSDIDRVKNMIIENIATKNMLGYSYAIAFILGAFIDTLAEFLDREMLLSDLSSDPILWFFLGWVWFYTAGFAGPWLFPSIYSGGDPNLSCSSVDFFILMFNTNLSTNVRSITTAMSEGKMIIFVESIRLDFKSRLSCIVDEKSGYSEAEEIDETFERLLDLISLHHHLAGPGQHVNDKDALDAELVIIWDSLPAQIQEVHAAVTVNRAYNARVIFVIGILNLTGAICGVFIEKLSAYEYFPMGASFLKKSGRPTFMNSNYASNSSIVSGGLGSGFYALSEFVGYGFAWSMPYLLFIEEADPGCGQKSKVQKIFKKYEDLRNLHDRAIGQDWQNVPDMIKYYVEDWRRDLRVSLHCLLTTKEGFRLRDTIDMFVNLANYRLDLA